MQGGGLFCDRFPGPKAVSSPLFNLSLHLIPTWHAIGLIKYVVCWPKSFHSFSFADQYLRLFGPNVELTLCCRGAGPPGLSSNGICPLQATPGHTPLSSRSFPSPNAPGSLPLVPVPQHTHTHSSSVCFLEVSEAPSIPPTLSTLDIGLRISNWCSWMTSLPLLSPSVDLSTPFHQDYLRIQISFCHFPV